MWSRRRLSKGNYFGILTGVAEPELNAGKEKNAGTWQVETQKHQLQEWRSSGARGRDSNQTVGFHFFQSAEKKKVDVKKGSKPEVFSPSIAASSHL